MYLRSDVRDRRSHWPPGRASTSSCWTHDRAGGEAWANHRGWPDRPASRHARRRRTTLRRSVRCTPRVRRRRAGRWFWVAIALRAVSLRSRSGPSRAELGLDSSPATPVGRWSVEMKPSCVEGVPEAGGCSGVAVAVQQAGGSAESRSRTSGDPVVDRDVVGVERGAKSGRTSRIVSGATSSRSCSIQATPWCDGRQGRPSGGRGCNCSLIEHRHGNGSFPAAGAAEAGGSPCRGQVCHARRRWRCAHGALAGVSGGRHHATGGGSRRRDGPNRQDRAEPFDASELPAAAGCRDGGGACSCDQRRRSLSRLALTCSFVVGAGGATGAGPHAAA
jgi:hypothetical protein